jgi:hypothetical protein
VLRNLNTFKFQRVTYLLCSGPADRGWRILPADDYWRDKEGDSVNQPGFQHQRGEKWPAFDEYALNRSLT